MRTSAQKYRGVLRLLAVVAMLAAGGLLVRGSEAATTAREATPPHDHGSHDHALLSTRLPDGKVITTHGGDSDRLPAATATTEYTNAAPKPPGCVTNPRIPAFQVVYAYPRDRGSRIASAADTIRSAVRLANGIIYQSARETSSRWDVRMRVRCDATGKISIRGYTLSKDGDDATGETFRQIVAAGRAAGYRDPWTKYLVFWDSPISGMCGQGQMHVDDRRVVDNGNNLGDTYAAVYGRTCWKGTMALHEIGHTMGAVQDSAPRSTGTSHCNQEQDIMCYVDGGPRGRTTSIIRTCTDRVHFDCGHNDYFRIGATTGYLASHWNVAWTKNRFLSFRSS